VCEFQQICSLGAVVFMCLYFMFFIVYLICR